MIKEITQFVKEIPPLVKERAMEPKAGLHILIRFDEEGNVSVVDSERYLGKKHGAVSEFLIECALRQEAGWMIDTNKCFDLPMKGIHSTSPYCVAFKRESWVGGDKYPEDRTKPNILERLESYFTKVFEDKYELDEATKQRSIQFKDFLKNKMSTLLESIPEYTELDWSNYIIIYMDQPLQKYLDFQEIYLAGGLFNTADYNIEVDGQIFGTSNFYNGFNSKKPFLTHQTASFDITSRINATDAKALAEFQIYAGKKLFPNPIPMFIEKSELTEKAILIFHRSEGEIISHRDIITELWKQKEGLGNYYLLYFANGAIQDFDYVAKFQYLISEQIDEEDEPRRWVIENVTGIKEKDKSFKSPISLTSVFDFEREVIGRLFDYKLVSYDEKKGTSFKYFEDIESKWYRPAMFSLLLKYRKPVYDFIYKSMRSGIGLQQFEDICMSSIMDDIRNHESNKEYVIKSKLNIFFSLYSYFNKSNNPQIMPSKIEENKAEIARVVGETDSHFTTDEAYAFGTGQLVYFLLSRSEAGDRTHAVLEPFLQKTNHAHLNEMIANTLLKYKHAISFDYQRFNRLAGEVLAYEPTTSLQQLRPFLLAGYFCPNIFFTKKSESPS